MKARTKEYMLNSHNDYTDLVTVVELQPEYPYDTVEYKDALNALIRNLHKISPSDIWKLIED